MKILVMDDYSEILSLLDQFLRHMNHEVVTVEEGGAALEEFLLAKNAGNPFDTVILDIENDIGMGGVETLKKLRGINPSTKIVMMSGDHQKLEKVKKMFVVIHFLNLFQWRP